MSARLLGVALVLEVLLLLVMDIFVLAKGGGPTGISFAPLNPGSAPVGAGIKAAAPGVGIFFALWSWVGFEATANYAEEARNPRKMVPRATYIAVISLGVLFTLTSWAVVLGHGLTTASNDAATNPGTFFFTVTSHRRPVRQRRHGVAHHHEHLRLRHGLPHGSHALLLRDGA